MPDVESLGPLWGAAGAIATAAGVFVVNWLRARGRENRADHAAANAAWMKYAQHQEARCESLEQGQVELREIVREQGKRLDECQEQHEDARRAHRECEEKHAAVVSRLNDLEGSVRVVETKVANGHGND